MLNRSVPARRWLGAALALAIAAPAAADLPEPKGSGGPRREAAPRSSAAPLPSSVRERLELLKDKRRERVRERKEQRERIQQLAQDFERSLSRPDANPKELRAKQEELFAVRAERRRERRMELRKRFGRAIAEPAVRAELELHARRAARLKRLQFLAATERTGKKRTAVLARVDRLLVAENARHDQAMQRLVTTQQLDATGAAAASGADAKPQSSGGTP